MHHPHRVEIRRWLMWAGAVPPDSSYVFGGEGDARATPVTAGEQFLPVLSVREGAVRSMMILRADGYLAYVTLLNVRDGGINGVTLVWDECETVFDPTRTVECCERLKGEGPTGAAVFHPMGMPPTYALIERAAHDQIPLITLGYGRADAADGRVFPYVFPVQTTYWHQNTAKIRFIGQRAGGMDPLKGRKIAHIYADNGYGRETIPILDTQAARYGFAVQPLTVPPPGLDQKATWLRVKVAQPDWIVLRTAGVMTMAALKEAAQVGFPRDKIVGNVSTCAEQDTVPAGEAARGFICASLLAQGETSRSSRRCSGTSMPRAKGLVPKAMSARRIGSEV
jgi:branched-chain amino acid transport system substrate-binding protein